MEVNFEKLVKKIQTSCPCCSNPVEEAINLPKYPLTEFYKEVNDKLADFISRLEDDISNTIYQKNELDSSTVLTNIVADNLKSLIK